MPRTLDSRKDFGFDADIDERIGMELMGAATRFDERIDEMEHEFAQHRGLKSEKDTKNIHEMRLAAQHYRRFAEAIGV